MPTGGPVPTVGLPPSPYYQTRPGNGFGIAALVLGILSIVTMFGGLLFGPLAVIFGFVQRGRARQAQTPTPGVAVAGIVTGFAGIAIGFLFVLAVAVPVFLGERANGYDAATKSDVRNLATAEETYFTDNNTYIAGTDSQLLGTLPRWTKSSTTTRVTVTAAPGSTIYQSYMAVAVSETGHSFCYNSTNSAAGVVSGSYC